MPSLKHGLSRPDDPITTACVPGFPNELRRTPTSISRFQIGDTRRSRVETQRFRVIVAPRPIKAEIKPGAAIFNQQPHRAT